MRKGRLKVKWYIGLFEKKKKLAAHKRNKDILIIPKVDTSYMIAI